MLCDVTVFYPTEFSLGMEQVLGELEYWRFIHVNGARTVPSKLI
jgi:hypothetical protein